MTLTRESQAFNSHAWHQWLCPLNHKSPYYMTILTWLTVQKQGLNTIPEHLLNNPTWIQSWFCCSVCGNIHAGVLLELICSPQVENCHRFHGNGRKSVAITGSWNPSVARLAEWWRQPVLVLRLSPCAGRRFLWQPQRPSSSTAEAGASVSRARQSGHFRSRDSHS